MNRYAECPTNAQLPYEISHEINGNTLTIKLPKDKFPKDKFPVQTVDKQAAEPTNILDVSCMDKYGKVLL